MTDNLHRSDMRASHQTDATTATETENGAAPRAEVGAMENGTFASQLVKSTAAHGRRSRVSTFAVVYASFATLTFGASILLLAAAVYIR